MSNLIQRKAQNVFDNLLKKGLHIVMIAVVAGVFAAISEQYSDRTPQLQVTFKQGEGKGAKQFTQWFNMKGYVLFSEMSPEDQKSGRYEARGSQGYAVDVTTNMRVEDAKKTEAALSIIDKLALDAGIKGNYTEADLVGKHIGINVAPDSLGRDKVSFTCTKAYAEKTIASATL